MPLGTYAEVDRFANKIKDDFLQFDIQPGDIYQALDLPTIDPENDFKLLMLLTKKRCTLADIGQIFGKDRSTIHLWLRRLMDQNKACSQLVKKQNDQYYALGRELFNLINRRVKELNKRLDVFEKKGLEALQEKFLENPSIYTVEIIESTRGHRDKLNSFLGDSDTEEVLLFLFNDRTQLEDFYDKTDITDKFKALARKGTTIRVCSANNLKEVFERFGLDRLKNFFIYYYTENRYVQKTLAVLIKQVKTKFDPRYEAIFSNMTKDKEITLYDRRGGIAEDLYTSYKMLLEVGLIADKIKPDEYTEKNDDWFKEIRKMKVTAHAA